MLRNNYEFIELIIFDLLTKVLCNHHVSMVLFILEMLTKVLRNHYEIVELIIFEMITKVLCNHHESIVLIIFDLLTKVLRKYHDPSHRECSLKLVLTLSSQ